MPANWSTFVNTVAPFLDSAVPKTERDTARVISNSYKASTSMVSISNIIGSIPILTPPTILMENAILDVFNKTKQSGRKSIPPYYIKWANELSSYWLQTKWNPLPPPIGYVGPITGVNTQFGGIVTTLSVNLFNAFNNPPSPVPLGNIICAKLVTAFQIHLLTITGLYIGTIPSPNGPIPGPPFPWIGIV